VSTTPPTQGAFTGARGWRMSGKDLASPAHDPFRSPCFWEQHLPVIASCLRY
jgi:hypothetical protein